MLSRSAGWISAAAGLGFTRIEICAGIEVGKRPASKTR